MIVEESDKSNKIQSLDNPFQESSEHSETEKLIIGFCRKYKYSYSRYNQVVTLSTPYSEWYFDISGPRFKLYHKNTLTKGSGKWSEDYHHQKQQKSFKKIKSIFIYISTHDRNKYCNESQEVKRIKHLLHAIKHSKSTIDR